MGTPGVSLRPPVARPPWSRALMPLLAAAMVVNALPGGSRLFASTAASIRVAMHGHSGRRILFAFLQPRDSAVSSPGAAGSSVDPGDAALKPPVQDIPAHEAAALRAADEGWARCGATREACAEAYRALAARVPADVALEAVVLGPGSEERVQHAMRAAEVAGLADVEDPRIHAPFLPAADRARMDDVGRALGLATLWSLGWPLPDGTRITSPFGERVHPVLGRTIVHKGVDLAASTGTPLKAPHQARVVHVGTDTAEGLYVVLDHGHGVQSVSCHLSAADVKRDARLARGDVYALTGASGRVTGPHLHYGVRVAGRFVDPVAVSRRAPADQVVRPPSKSAGTPSDSPITE